MKQEIGNVIRRFVTLCGLIFIIMVVLGPLLHVIDGISNKQMGYLTICAATAALSSLVFISSEELHGVAWWGRELLCLSINMVVVLPLTYYAKLWKSAVSMVVVLLILWGIAFGNHMMEFLHDVSTANQINRKIRELR